MSERQVEPDQFTVTRDGLAALFDHVDEAILCCDESGTIRFASEAVRTLMGFDPVMMVGRNLVDFVHPDQLADTVDAMARWAGRHGRPRGEPVSVRTSAGTWRPVHYDAALGTELGSIGSLVVTLRADEDADSDHRQFHLQSLNGDRIVRLASAFLHVPFEDFDKGLSVALDELASLDWVTRASVWLIEGERAVLRAVWTAAVDPPKFSFAPRVRIADYRLLEVIMAGEEVYLGRPWSHGDDFSRERKLLEEGGITSLMAAPMRSGGTVTGQVVIESTLNLVDFDATHATTLRSAGAILAEAFVRHETERRLAEQARTDRVTGLGNRWAFDEALGHALDAVASGASPGFGLALLDIDHFKVVNDSVGHLAGDRLLADVANRLTGAATQGTTIARLGGDDMLVLIDHTTDLDESLAAVRHLTDSLASPFDVGGTAAIITTSVGMLHQGDADTTPTELLQLIDLAVGRAKALGGDTIQVDDPAHRAGQASQMHRIADLRRALSTGGLTVHYQGEWDLTTGELVGAEALVRWEHGDDGLLTAAEFVPLAEASGMVNDLGRFVLLEACRAAAPWVDELAGHDFVLRVNVAAQQLRSRDLVDQVVDALEDSGLPAGALCIELTESTLLADPGGSTELFERLRALGVGLAIDDFGTGYSSLLQLKRMPLTALKIDRAFVMGLPDDANDRAIVAATLGLAASLGFSATAEGVETEEQRDALVEMGCRRAQGFLLARPEPADTFVARVHAASHAIPT